MTPRRSRRTSRSVRCSRPTGNAVGLCLGRPALRAYVASPRPWRRTGGRGRHCRGRGLSAAPGCAGGLSYHWRLGVACVLRVALRLHTVSISCFFPRGIRAHCVTPDPSGASTTVAWSDRPRSCGIWVCRSASVVHWGPGVFAPLLLLAGRCPVAGGEAVSSVLPPVSGRTQEDWCAFLEWLLTNVDSGFCLYFVVLSWHCRHLSL